MNGTGDPALSPPAEPKGGGDIEGQAEISATTPSEQHPLDEAMRMASSHFLAGDYSSTRDSLRPILLSDSATPEQRALALRLSRSMGLEPGAVAIGAVCICFYLVVLWLAY